MVKVLPKLICPIYTLVVFVCGQAVILLNVPEPIPIDYSH